MVGKKICLPFLSSHRFCVRGTCSSSLSVFIFVTHTQSSQFCVYFSFAFLSFIWHFPTHQLCFIFWCLSSRKPPVHSTSLSFNHFKRKHHTLLDECRARGTFIFSKKTPHSPHFFSASTISVALRPFRKWCLHFFLLVGGIF